MRSSVVYVSNCAMLLNLVIQIKEFCFSKEELKSLLFFLSYVLKPRLKWALINIQRVLTPPNSEIICGQNVGTKVVCVMILFFEKKAMLKI